MRRLTRRDFLKLAGAAALEVGMPRLFAAPSRQPAAGAQNVLIVVYDAFSAHHISLYGYPRRTTPNLERLAGQAIVYHNHRAGGNFTTPGTASLLTGTLPWTHRATNGDDTVLPSFANRSIFHAFDGHYRLAYSHNLWAVTLLQQFFNDIDELTPWERLFLQKDTFLSDLFPHDQDTARLGWARTAKLLDDNVRYSLFLGPLIQAYQKGRFERTEARFPLGLPSVYKTNLFNLEDATDYLAERVARVPQPFFGYYHFLPPHHPYKTRQDFYGVFADDGYAPPKKPQVRFSHRHSEEELAIDRRAYDEYVCFVDEEFGRLYQKLEDGGALENTWLVLTADHGELFERGESGHTTVLLHEPVVHIPLMIFPPGKKEHIDITENTSAIDLLPTLASVTGTPIPDWAEGRVLPPFDGSGAERDTFSVEAIDATKRTPIFRGSTKLVRGKYELIYFFGFRGLGKSQQMVLLYDLEEDPDELHDLSNERVAVRDELLSALKRKLAAANAPYA